jgi:hypothetical protein
MAVRQMANQLRVRREALYRGPYTADVGDLRDIYLCARLLEENAAARGHDERARKCAQVAEAAKTAMPALMRKAIGVLEADTQ